MWIKVDAEKCIVGCRLCLESCCREKKEEISDARARLVIRQNEDNTPSRYVPTVCMGCPDPACVRACPREALIARPGGGAISVTGRCIGCLKCAEVCPAGVCQIHPDHVDPMICDLCGGSPACVKACVAGAITMR